MFVSLDVTFWEAIPFYGEASDLSDLFATLDTPSEDEVIFEGENEEEQSDSGKKQTKYEGVMSGPVPQERREGNEELSSTQGGNSRSDEGLHESVL